MQALEERRKVKQLILTPARQFALTLQVDFLSHWPKRCPLFQQAWVVTV